jgi:CheY-like chemotaxis protein
MPVMDGYAATREIRQQPRFADLPIVAMTANVMADDIARASAAGMNDHIGKPVDPDEMFRVMARWMVPSARTRQAPVTRRKSEHVAFDCAELIGIDCARALATVEHDADLYRRLLTRFRDGQRGFVTAYRAAWGSEDKEAPVRLAHTLKGLAGTIGASGVQRAAGELETAGKRSRAEADMEAALRRVDEMLSPVIEGLDQVLAKAHVAPAREEGEQGIGALLEGLKDLLREDDPDALEQADALIAALPERDLTGLKEAMETFDFDAALAELERLSMALNGNPAQTDMPISGSR